MTDTHPAAVRLRNALKQQFYVLSHFENDGSTFTQDASDEDVDRLIEQELGLREIEECLDDGETCMSNEGYDLEAAKCLKVLARLREGKGGEDGTV